jgi:hypothetical protein
MVIFLLLVIIALMCWPVIGWTIAAILILGLIGMALPLFIQVLQLLGIVIAGLIVAFVGRKIIQSTKVRRQLVR